MHIHRRHFLIGVAGGFSALLSHGRLRAARAPSSGMGVCIYCLGNRIRAKREGDVALDDPLTFLEHCREIGAGGMQVPLRVREDSYCAGLRRMAEKSGLFIEGIAKLPSGDADVERFEAEVRTARSAGARVVRVVMIPGRRYERYKTAEQFDEAARKGRKALELAARVATKHRVRLAVENHNDQRIEDRLKVLKSLSSEYVGACVDCSNSVSLLEDPGEVLKAYAPYAFSVHLKDLAVEEHETGFYITDVPLGEGFLDLEGIVDTIRKTRPEARFSLEVITRKPHDVPCLADEYWPTLRSVPARDLARTLRLVQSNAVERLPSWGELTAAEWIDREADAVRKSLAYAREKLSL